MGLFDPNRRSKKLTLGQKAKIGASIGLAVYVVVLEKKRVDRLVALAYEMATEHMDEAYKSGIEYGLTLEKTIRLVRDAA